MRWSGKQMFWWGAFAALILTIALIVLPLFLNPDYLKNLALQQIQRTFGSHVTVGQTSFALFPSPHFLVSDIVVQEQPESHAVFRAKSMSLDLGIWPLLMKKIVVREFLVESPEIELRRESGGEWRFLSYASNDSPIVSLAEFLVLGKFEVTDGKIIVIDESPRESVRGFVIEDVAFVSETSHEGSSIDSTFDLSGKIRQTEELAPFRIKGELEALWETPLHSVINEPVGFEQITFSGKVRADDLEIKQIGEFLPNGQSLVEVPGTLSVKSQVTWVQNAKTSRLSLSKINLSSSFIDLDGSANTEMLEDGHHMMGFSMRSSNVDLDMIRQYLPRTWMPDDLLPVWGTGEWGGGLNIAEARVTGSTREDVRTSVTGTFRLTDGYLRIPDWPTTDHIQGTVVVEPDRIQLSEVHGIYDGIPVEVTEGLFLLKESGPWGNVGIQGPVPAEKVRQVVTQLGAPTDFGLLSSWKVLDGTGLLRLQFTGNLLESPGLMFQSGEFNPEGLVIQIPGLPHPLTEGHGTIIFSRESTVFQGIQGNVGAFPLALNGTINYQGVPRFDPLTIQGGFAGEDLLPVSETQATSPGMQMTGPLTASVILTGPTGHPKLKGWIDGRDALIAVPSLLRKHAGQDGRLEFEGQFRPGSRVHFERVELIMLPLRLRGQGTIRYRPKVTWEARFDSGPVYLGVLPEGIRVLGDIIQSGILEVQLKGSGRGTDWTQWNTKGWVALTEGVVALRGMTDPISNLFVRLKVDENLLDLKRMEFRLKNSEAVITGFMKNWKTTPIVSVLFDSPQFDIDLLIPKEGRSAIRDGIEWLAAHGSLEGSVYIDRPSYKTLSGKKLSGALRIHDNLVSVDKVQAMVAEHGTVGGRFFVHLPENRPAAMRASFQAKDLPFENVLSLFGEERRWITGKMAVRGMLQGHGRDDRGIIPTLNGSLEVSLGEGYIRKGTIVPRILTLLNLPHVLRGKFDLEANGFPFTTVSSKLTVEDGVFSTKDMLIQSPIMKISAAGKYDWKGDRLEGISAVSPFGAYSDLLKDLPLFGRIFSGDRKGIATAMFSIAGPLGEPEVEYLPMESVKTGLTGLAKLAFDVLKNTLTLPYDLLKGSKGDEDSLSPDSNISGVPGPL
ncbi:MAG TPA: AsmA-like C-terminal region-containing protein [Nitrospirales bacterium]|nr:AsmA-like C-terminal region-containing protein [Nitrospirales bacterium]